jgi:hypothetical protein
MEKTYFTWRKDPSDKWQFGWTYMDWTKYVHEFYQRWPSGKIEVEKIGL